MLLNRHIDKYLGDDPPAQLNAGTKEEDDDSEECSDEDEVGELFSPSKNKETTKQTIVRRLTMQMSRESNQVKEFVNTWADVPVINDIIAENETLRRRISVFLTLLLSTK
jgi:hypothetical protein